MTGTRRSLAGSSAGGGAPGAGGGGSAASAVGTPGGAELPDEEVGFTPVFAEVLAAVDAARDAGSCEHPLARLPAAEPAAGRHAEKWYQ